jgi:hypothetical protein
VQSLLVLLVLNAAQELRYDLVGGKVVRYSMEAFGGQNHRRHAMVLVHVDEFLLRTNTATVACVDEGQIGQEHAYGKHRCQSDITWRGSSWV